jgi:ribosomal protein S17E
MAKCITDVISPRQETSATQSDSSIVSSFTEAVEKAANSINNVSSKLEATNCTKVVFDWCRDTMGLDAYAAVGMMSNLNKGFKQYNHFNFPVSIDGALTLSKSLCQTIGTWIAWIQGTIDIATKAAFVLFAKIDAARLKLEEALLRFNAAVFKCITDVLSDIKMSASLEVGIGASVSLDFKWEELLQIMIDCPCFCRAIACVTNCNKDADGNDISRNPEMVIECLQNKFPLSLGIGVGIGGGIAGSLNDLLYDFLMKLYNSIKAAIEMTFEMLMKPLRALIKAYADLLTQKFDVSGFIKMVGNFECFFIYTLEYKNNREFYGMSVIDMINTFKSWTVCFSHLCPGLMKDIEGKIKEINESLRLNDVFWQGAFEADLYDLCIAAKLGYKSFSDYEFREIYRDNPKTQFDSLLSQLEASAITRVCKNHKKTSAANTPTSKVEEAIMFRTAPDRENEVNVGEKPITKSEQKKCISISHNLIDKTVSPYFTEKYYQLLRMLADYEINEETVDELTKILDNCSKKVYPVNMSKPFTPFPSNQSARAAIEVYPADIEVTYELVDDYDEEAIARIIEG